MNVEEVECYKSQRRVLISFMVEAVMGKEEAALENIQSLEDEVSTAFGNTTNDTFMVTGAQSQSDIELKRFAGCEFVNSDDGGILVEEMLVKDAVVSGSEQLLRFAKKDDGEYLLSPSGGPQLQKFPLLTSKQNMFVILLNLAERSVVTFR